MKMCKITNKFHNIIILIIVKIYYYFYNYYENNCNKKKYIEDECDYGQFVEL